MPVEQDPLIGGFVNELKKNTPSGQPVLNPSGNPPPMPSGEDPLIAQMRGEQKSTYQESHSPTFHLNYNGPAQERMAWGDVASGAAKNLLPSTGRALYGMAQPILHPIDTATNIYGLGKGAYSKAKGALGYQQDAEQKSQDEAQLNSIIDFYKNRYGTMAGFQHAIAEDPASVLLDLSVPLTGGETALAKMPGMLGKVGELGVASKLTNPIAAVAGTGKVLGKIPMGGVGGFDTLGEMAGAAGDKIAGGVLSPISSIAGVSKPALPTAFKSGLAGGQEAADFTKQMRGKVPANQVLDTFDNAFSSLASRRKNDYLTGMGGIKNAPSIKDFTPIQQAANDAIASISHYPTAAPTRDAIRNIMSDFKNGQIGEYQFNPKKPSLYDYDKLKQALNDIAKSPMTPQGAVVGDIAKAVRQEIGNVSPEYGKIMDRYGEASDQMKDIKHAFGKTGQADIARMRKIMSGMSKEDRMSLLEELSKEKGGETLINQIAGRELSDWSHNSLEGLLGGGGLGYGASYLLGTHPALAIPSALAGSYVRSPRALGETAYGAGAALRGAKNLSPAASAALGEMGHYQMLGNASEDDELNPYLRAPRKSGGRTTGSAAAKAQKLIGMVDRIRKDQSKETSSLLNLDDDTVIKALAVANKHI